MFAAILSASGERGQDLKFFAVAQLRPARNFVLFAKTAETNAARVEFANARAWRFDNHFAVSSNL